MCIRVAIRDAIRIIIFSINSELWRKRYSKRFVKENFIQNNEKKINLIYY